MRCQGEEGQAVEEGAIHHAVGEVLRWKQHDEQHDKLSKEDENPGDDRTNDAAGIFDEPHVVLLLMTGRKILYGLQATSLPLDVPETRALDFSSYHRDAILSGMMEKETKMDKLPHYITKVSAQSILSSHKTMVSRTSIDLV